MKELCWSNGTFVELPENPFVWVDGDWHDQLHAAGYSRLSYIGSDFAAIRMESWGPGGKGPKTEYRYFVNLTFGGDSGENVWMKTLPDVLDFMQHYSSLLNASLMSELTEMLQEARDTLFDETGGIFREEVAEGQQRLADRRRALRKQTGATG